MKRYRCNYIECGINLSHHNIQVCCKSAHSGGGRIVLQDKYPENSKLDWRKILKTKRKMQNDLLNGKILPNCKDCVFLEEMQDMDLLSLFQHKIFKTHQNINMVDVNSFINCNCRCSYCEIWDTKNFKEHSSLPIFKDMFAKNLLQNKDGGYISFAGGEPTIMLDFEEIVNLCIENKITNYLINSNGIIYSKAIEKLLKKTDTKLVISIDSGCKETYQKIKNVPCFDKVVENMKKYAQNQIGSLTKVRSKFIFIPGINDNLEEINKWYDLSISIGIKIIVLDIEKNWFIEHAGKIPDNITELIEHVKNRCKNDSIMLDYFEQLKLFYKVQRFEHAF